MNLFQFFPCRFKTKNLSIEISYFHTHYSWSDVDSRSLEHIERAIDIVKVVNIAIILSLATVSKECDTHILNAILTVSFPTLELIKYSRLLIGCNDSSTRRSLVHLNFFERSLAFFLFLLAVALEILRHLGYILCFKVLLLGSCSICGHLIDAVFHLVLAHASHILLNEMLLILSSLLVFIDHVSSHDIDLLGLEP